MSCDHLFPQYHVRPAYGYLNDPNGPIMVDGLVHLYFQYRHGLDPALPVLWGHVSSPDLVRWDYHRPAIAPHPARGDRDGCWSGNTVVDDGTVRAFYSGFVHGETLQQTLTAISTDGGYAFGAPEVAVPPPELDEAIAHLRDPFVWREGSSWRMALGAGTAAGVAMVRVYTSPDLRAWTYVGPMAQLARTRQESWDSGELWECPQVVRVDGTLLALVGSWSPSEGVMKVLSFVVPGDPEPTEPQDGQLDPSVLTLVDHGPNFYAASALGDHPDGPLIWGWATEGRTPDSWQPGGWSGMLTLPRALSMRRDGSVASTPPTALDALRVEPTGQVVPHDGVKGGVQVSAQFEFVLDRFDQTKGVLTVALRCGPQEHLEVSVDLTAGQVSVDRDHASTDPGAFGGVFTVTDLPELAAPGAAIRGFVDGSILELFLPGGQVMTTRMYPTAPPPWRLVLLETPSSARATIWELAQPH